MFKFGKVGQSFEKAFHFHVGDILNDYWTTIRNGLLLHKILSENLSKPQLSNLIGVRKQMFRVFVYIFLWRFFLELLHSELFLSFNSLKPLFSTCFILFPNCLRLVFCLYIARFVFCKLKLGLVSQHLIVAVFVKLALKELLSFL